MAKSQPHRLIFCTVLITLGFVATPAMAAVVGSSSISSLTASITKLDSSNNTPFISWDGPQVTALISANGGSANGSWADERITNSFNAYLTTAVAAVSNPQGSASAKITAGGPFELAAISAGGSVAGGVSLWNGSYFNSNAYASLPFIISPMTVVHFTAAVSMKTEVSVGLDFARQGFEYAGADLHISASGPSKDELLGFHYSEAFLNLYAGNTFNGPATDPLLLESLIPYGPSKDLSRDVVVSFFNRYDTPVTGNLYVSLDSYGFSSISSVPEPSTAALFAIGLAGLGYARSRSSRTA